MERLQLKKRLKWSGRLIVFGFLFNVLETIYFLIRYGWHYLPYNDAEVWCDTIAVTMILVGLYMFLDIVYKIVEIIILESE